MICNSWGHHDHDHDDYDDDDDDIDYDDTQEWSNLEQVMICNSFLF